MNIIEDGNRNKRESSGKVKKKGIRFYKRIIAGLAGALVVIVGAMASYFYIRYDGIQGQISQLQEQIAKTQQEVQELLEENELLRVKADMVPVIAPDGTYQKFARIPFVVDLTDWKYLLVNERHPLQQGYEPQLAYTRNGQRVDKRIKADLEEMIDDARKEGMRLMICSSYRDYERQDVLMDESIGKYVKKGLDYRDAFFKTKEQIALTGASEHHTGLAVDIVGTRYQSLDSAQANTREAKWLAEHAQEYGFILRYPRDKEEITMISFESWHYRYVGKEAAVFMKENNLCLEEFVKLAQAQKRLAESVQEEME